MDSNALRDGWIELLERYEWDWFCTFTFQSDVHPEAAAKLFRVWVSKLNRFLYGRYWYKNPMGGVFWVRALEYQKRGVIHYHALIAGIADLNDKTRRFKWMEEWEHLAGYSRIELIESPQAVSRYISKYVVKGGEIDISQNLVGYRRQRHFKEVY